MDGQSRTYELPPTWLAWTVGIACVIAILDMPYGFYMVLRPIVAGYAAYISYVYFRSARAGLAWTAGCVALLYNPFYPISMTKGAHSFFNLLTTAAIFVELYAIRPRDFPSDREIVSAAERPLIRREDRADYTKFVAREILIVAVSIAATFVAIFAWDKFVISKEAETEKYSVAPTD
ncbi:MAG: hypothetical protein KKA44_08280 [Alphaproteobacteria bacterium]|nr:hypothetical protein [Alphaproteobacteria bacterium]MBU0866423.1 hypothetical protein [Alphaproteobacteria bacterium]MBU1824956.1 hypothetical protein [Alphaproteobacteria bacterium]